MGRASLALFLVVGAVLTAGGCAAFSEGRGKEPAPDMRRAVAAGVHQQSSPRGEVAPAVAYDRGEAAPIRQTADFLQEPVAAMKKGAAKAAQAVTPTTPVQRAEDPTSLATKAKPSPELFIAAAQVHEQAGRIAQAEQAFQQAFTLSPHHVTAQLAYARFKDRQKQSREALDVYFQAAKDHPNDAAVFNDLGLYYARRGMNREAVAAFERATQIQPKRPLYRNNLAMLLVDAGQADAAMAHLMAVYTEAEACYKLGYLLQKKGDREPALQLFARAVQLNPAMTEAKAWHDHLQSQLAARPSPAAPPAGVAEVPPPRMAVRPFPPAPPADLNPPPSAPHSASPTPPPQPPAPPAPVVRPLPGVPRPLPKTGAQKSPDAPADGPEAAPQPPLVSLPLPGSAARLASAEEPAMLPPAVGAPSAKPATAERIDADEPPLPPPASVLRTSSPQGETP